MIEKFKSIFSENPKVIILGFGKEGRSSYTFIRKHFPSIELTVADRNDSISNDILIQGDSNLKLQLGVNYYSGLKNFDLIIKSPGVKIIDTDNALKGKITSQTDLFLQCYADQVIGVTGTKGKSTTVSLIFHFLVTANRKVILLGNIGVPAFDKIDEIDKNTIIVYELSAHQLEFLHVSPSISVLLNIFPEHLDYFDDYNSYKDAKHSIFRNQSKNDTLIVNETIIEALPKLNQITNCITSSNKFNIKDSPLLGIHNMININAALLAIEKYGENVSEAISSIKSFKCLPHRLENVGVFGGVKFINDSISTIPESTIAAIDAIVKVDTLILGGWDRGLDYHRLVEYLKKSTISNFILLGKAGDRIFDLFNMDSGKVLKKAQSMEEVFENISTVSKHGDICLLSPAAASYDQFHSFEHRGDAFKKLAREFKFA